MSYRTADAAYAAAGIYHALEAHFGAARVFRDRNSIRPGSEYPKEIRRALAGCTVLVAVVGQQWLEVRAGDGLRRLDDPRDWVRLELEQAIQLDVPIIPVLLDGATEPDPDDLAEEIGQFATMQSYRVRHDHFDEDLAGLIAALGKHMPARPALRRRLALVGLVLVTALVAVLADRAIGQRGTANPAASAPPATTGATGTGPSRSQPATTAQGAKPAGRAAFTAPADGQTVARCTDIRGTAPTPQDGTYYMLMARMSDGNLFILGPRLQLDSSGAWELHEVTIGGDDAPPAYRYSIMLVRTREPTTSDYEHMFFSGGNTGSPDMWSGTDVLATLQVTRNTGTACKGRAYPG